MSLTLKELTEHWSNAVAGDFVLPNSPYPQYEQINAIGKSILELLDRIDVLEERINKLEKRNLLENEVC